MIVRRREPNLDVKTVQYDVTPSRGRLDLLLDIFTSHFEATHEINHIEMLGGNAGRDMRKRKTIL